MSKVSLGDFMCEDNATYVRTGTSMICELWTLGMHNSLIILVPNMDVRPVSAEDS